MPLPPGRITPVFPSIGQSVLLVIGVLFLQVGGGAAIMAVAALGGAEWATDGLLILFNPWSLIVINGVAIGAVLTVGLRAAREPAADFFVVRPFSARLLPALLLTSLGLAVVLAETDNIIVDVLRRLSWPGAHVPDLLNLADHPGSSFLLLVIMAPLTEEYLFRGMILRGLLVQHRAAVAIGLTALLFGLIHANLRQFFLGIVIGAVFGWWYVRTRSVGPCLLGHAVFNAVAWLTGLFPEALEPFVYEMAGETVEHHRWWFTLGGLAATALGLWSFDRLAENPPPDEPPTGELPDEPPLLEPIPPPVSLEP
jgi:uncharacterized protein